MPTPTLSPYEVDRNQRRDAGRRQNQRDRLVLTHRRDVERAISLDRRASRLERTIQAFDRNEDGVQQRAVADRTAWWCELVFVLAVTLYVVGEFFASGDVAEWLAHQVAPLFAGSQDDAVASAQTPVWLRRGAGVGFVVLMLGVTLLLKFVTTWFAHGLEDRRSQVEAGDHLAYWRLTIGVLLNHLTRVGYMAAVAMFYLWLFGFAQERAALTAAIAADQKAVEQTDLGIKIEDGEIETDEAVGKSDTSKVSEVTAGGKLAYATGVVYVCLWLLHGLVLLLPTEGFGRELPLAHFKRGAAERKVESMREDEERTLRDVLERIHTVEGEDREILIRETQPVAKRVNDAARRPAMDVPIPPGSEADPQEASAHQGQSPDGAAGTAATNNSSTPPGSLGQYAAADAHEDVYRAIFDAPLPPKPQQRT